MNEEKRSICDAIFSAIQDDIRNLCDTEIFTQSTFMELGEFFYGKLINSVEGATVDLINTVVSVLNKNSNQAEQNEYYENLCQVLGFELLPKEAYDTVCSKFNELFVTKFNSVVRVAHGRYYSNPSTLNDEIFAKELILDLCLLVHMFVRTSETERMYRFVHRRCISHCAGSC